MKIGIIHGFVGGGGGTEKTLLSIIESLSERGHNITLYTVSKPSIEISGIRIISSLPFRLPILGLYQRYLESKLIEKAKDVDIIIQASGGLVLPQENNKKIIIYCHHDFQNETKKDTTKYKGLWSWYYKPYYLLSQKFIKHIADKNIVLISNSKFIQDSIKKKFSKNSVIIYPPVDLEIFQNDVKKEQSVITISRYSQEKNLEFAVDVLRDFDAKYTIIGNTRSKVNELYFENLKTKVKNSKAEILLLKNVERSTVIESLKKSKVYFHASPETFGISVVESIAAGCVPIVPNNSAHEETVPIQELRYDQNNKKEAQEKVKKALAGNYDELIKPLRESIKSYDKNVFKKSFSSFVENIQK